MHEALVGAGGTEEVGGETSPVRLGTLSMPGEPVDRDLGPATCKSYQIRNFVHDLVMFRRFSTECPFGSTLLNERWSGPRCGWGDRSRVARTTLADGVAVEILLGSCW